MSSHAPYEYAQSGTGDYSDKNGNSSYSCYQNAWPPSAPVPTDSSASNSANYSHPTQYSYETASQDAYNQQQRMYWSATSTDPSYYVIPLFNAQGQYVPTQFSAPLIGSVTYYAPPALASSLSWDSVTEYGAATPTPSTVSSGSSSLLSVSPSPPPITPATIQPPTVPAIPEIYQSPSPRIPQELGTTSCSPPSPPAPAEREPVRAPRSPPPESLCSFWVQEVEGGKPPKGLYIDPACTPGALAPRVRAYQLSRTGVLTPVREGPETLMPWLSESEDEDELDAECEQEDEAEEGRDVRELRRRARKDKVHQCGECRKWFDRPSALKTHMNAHSGEQPYRCSHAGCDRRFSVHSNAKRHMRTHDRDPSSKSGTPKSGISFIYEPRPENQAPTASMLAVPTAVRWVSQHDTR